MNKVLDELIWVGSQQHFVDMPHIHCLSDMVIGRYGGSSEAGQYKNEDGCLVWKGEEGSWEFAMILDAHNTAKSAELVVEQFVQKKSDIQRILSHPLQSVFKSMEKLVLEIFQNDEFLSVCRKIKGETACLIVVRKDKYVWWFSVGDCLLYLFHPELAALSQYQLNQRQFYEWIGQVNTFEQVVPCYSSGVRELRKGVNHIFLTTDGLIECPGEPYSNPKDLGEVFSNSENDASVKALLAEIQSRNVRDSTTIVSWKINIFQEVSRPSDE
ncbi:protein phosphatase 2C domain-containing protein [Peribacillus alkalitolerans]|uniref:protein phosphatase 2C domain-containing protein n=1 Tax=Peribacillus alkalitolerans TaxID=1550385 RepID=UPI0013D2DF13|nr:protein phosphatase 2C domain-containing protein [Peribacillus alkalitolerans]